MLALADIPEHLEAAYQQCKTWSKELYEKIKDQADIKTIPGKTELFNAAGETSVLFIKKGLFKLYCDEKNLRFYSDDDFVNTGVACQTNLILKSDFATEVAFFDRDRLLAMLADHADRLRLWHTICETESKINLCLSSVYMAEDRNVDSQLRSYKQGDLIIEKGEKPTDMYEMIEGEAVVISNGHEIGRVGPEEFFGEISFLTESSRSASVRATDRCLVRVISKEDFLQQIRTNPQFIITISRKLAQRVVALNKKIVSQ